MTRLRKVAMEKVAESSVDVLAADFERVVTEIKDAHEAALKVYEALDVLISGGENKAIFKEKVLDVLDVLSKEYILETIKTDIEETKKYDY